MRKSNAIVGSNPSTTHYHHYHHHGHHIKHLHHSHHYHNHHHHHHHHYFHHSLQYHHHHNHSHHISYKERLLPLYRSILADKHYSQDNEDDTITGFLSKLLGLRNDIQSRPRLGHKSRSTTSITKSSVISSYQVTLPDDCTSCADNIKQAEADLSSDDGSSTLEPYHLHQQQPEKQSETASSTHGLRTIQHPNMINATINSVNGHKRTTSSAAMDALVTALQYQQQQQLTIQQEYSAADSNRYNEDNYRDKRSEDTLIADDISNMQQFPNRFNHNSSRTAAAPIKANTERSDDIPPVILSGRSRDTEVIMTEGVAEMIRSFLPQRFKIYCKWMLLYSLDQHGASLSTLFSKMNEGPCVMIIKDADGQLFGAYLSDSFAPRSHYYGTGECFLWTSSLNGDIEKEAVQEIVSYKWTGKNDYLILSNLNFIAIGGGNGTFGLWLNSCLDKGYSSACPTFDNKILTVHPDFRCVGMEIWGLDI